MTTNKPEAWVTADTVDEQVVNGKPRRIWWENNEGVGIPIYTTPQPEVSVPEIIEAVANFVGSQEGGPFTPAVIKAVIIGQLEYGNAFTKLLTTSAPTSHRAALAAHRKGGCK